MEDMLVGAKGGPSEEVWQMQEMVLQLQAEMRELKGKLAVSEGRRCSLLVSDTPNASTITHFGGREGHSRSTPKPTTRPRTRFYTTPAAPVNTPETGSTLDDSSTVDMVETNSWQPTSVRERPTCDLSDSGAEQAVKGNMENLERDKHAPAKVETKRPNAIPDRFNGKTPWGDLLQHFEACKLANEWSDGQAKILLAVSL